MKAEAPQAHKSHDGALGVCKENITTGLGLRLGRQVEVSSLPSS